MANMNEAIIVAYTLCPQYNLTEYITNIFNRTNFHNRTFELASYACYFQNSEVTFDDIIDRLNALYLATFIVGFTGSALALIVLTRGEYKTRIGFCYHRTINLMELFNTVFILMEPLNSWYGEKLATNAVWMYFYQYIAQKVGYTIRGWTGYIIIWITIDRAMAGQEPIFYRTISTEKAKMVRSALLITFLIAFFLTLPENVSKYVVFDEAQQKFFVAYNDFGKSYAMTIIVYAHICIRILGAIVLTVAAGASIAGYIAFSSRRRKLLASQSNSVTDVSQLLQEYSTDIQLCLLQLCEALPLALNQVVFHVLNALAVFVNSTGITAANAPIYLSYEDAMAALHGRMARFRCYLPVEISGFLTTAGHFYWYFAFSPEFRRSFLSLFRRGDKVGSVAGE